MLILSISSFSQTYTNPILGGDYPDPTIMREGSDYYMTHSAFDYQPGLTVFHSRDLVHWEPISYALRNYLGSVWAPDICKYKDKYYIYFTIATQPRSNYVVWANNPAGPWSAPIDLHIGNIDPCHVVGEDGSRWLFMSAGKRVRLTDDGLATVPGTEEVVYSGWHYPEDWETEGFCAPNNPLIHTWSKDERWWSKGHGSIVDTPDGKWVIVYHSYEKDFTCLGRQTLMEPIYLGQDGWFHRYDQVDVALPIDAPIKNLANIDHHARLSEFRLGLEWKFYKAFDPNRVKVNKGELILKAQGNSPGTSAPLMFVAGIHRYQIEAEIELQGDVTAGLVMYYNSQFYQGTGFDCEKRYRYRKGGQTRGGMNSTHTNHMWLRLVNRDNIITGWYSLDGKDWKRETWGMDCSGYNHNTLYEFQSVLPGVFASGSGYATFKNFKFTRL